VVRYLLELAGIGADRMRLYWVSAAEGQLFARYVMEYTEAVLAQGPFFSEDFREPLAAVEATLNSPRVRWLTGMDVQVTDRGNVYGERLDQARYHELIRDAVAEEYEKALISETLKSGPHSVRNIALETGLPIYTVSCRLNELERGRRVQLEGYRGTTPLFSRSAE
jgi:hypothetical protein